MQEDMKNRDFRPMYRLISEIMRDIATVTNLLWKANRKPYEWCHFQWRRQGHAIL